MQINTKTYEKNANGMQRPCKCHKTMPMQQNMKTPCKRLTKTISTHKRVCELHGNGTQFNSNKAKHTEGRQTKFGVSGAGGLETSSPTAPAVPAEALARWEAVATESAQRLDEVLRRASAAEAEGEVCAAREAALRERV